MSAIPTQSVPARSPAVPAREPPVRKLSADEYQKMYEAGILVGRDLDLIDGVVYDARSGSPRPLSLSDYHRMLDVGILHEGDPVELIDGTMRWKMTKGTIHDAIVDVLDDLITPMVPEWRVRTQSAISASDYEPEPDLVVVKGPARRYLDHHPRPDEIALLIEVADSSVHFDCGGKRQSYANAGVIEYWVVSIPDRVIDVYTDPTGPHAEPTYRGERQYTMDESVPVRVEGREVGRVAVREVMPRAGVGE